MVICIYIMYNFILAFYNNYCGNGGGTGFNSNFNINGERLMID